MSIRRGWPSRTTNSTVDRSALDTICGGCGCAPAWKAPAAMSAAPMINGIFMV